MKVTENLSNSMYTYIESLPAADQPTKFNDIANVISRSSALAVLGEVETILLKNLDDPIKVLITIRLMKDILNEQKKEI